MKEQAQRPGATVVIGNNLHYENVGAKGEMLMVKASGMAIKF